MPAARRRRSVHTVPFRAPDGIEYVSLAQDTTDGRITKEAVEEAHMKLVSLPPKLTKKAVRELRLKIGMCVEVFANYNKQDGLTNGADGFVRAITHDETDTGIKIVWVELNDERVGRRTREAHRDLAEEGIQENLNWTPNFRRT